MERQYLYLLSEFELLRGVNAISRSKGGTCLGTVGSVDAYQPEVGALELYTGGTYRNQYLISVELYDAASDGFGAAVPPGRHQWTIRLGFCQTQITRAPRGGFTLGIPPSLISMCPTVDHLVELFDCMAGRAAERREKLARWHRSVTTWREQRTPIALDITAFIRDDVLVHQLATGMID